jgi:predicted ABC-type ATPase
MEERNLYIIAGCNGAGKTTASYTILPEVLGCYEFVNADEIAQGLSPFNPENAAIEAGRIMLDRIDKFIKEGVDFAFETTLATKTFAQKIKLAQANGYKVKLMYFWLNSPNLAHQRVKQRVSKGGHNIPDEVIIRRYFRGIQNFFDLYLPIVDSWVLCNNTNDITELVAEKKLHSSVQIYNFELWNEINESKNES